MKTGFKGVVAAVLTGAIIMSVAGCVSFEQISNKEFKKALTGAGKIDEEEITEVKDATYEGADLKRKIIASDGKCLYSYMEFDDKDDAFDAFKDIYDDFGDAVDDDDFDGKYSKGISESSYSGYLLVDGDSDDKDFVDGKCYGGIYYKEDTIVIVMANSQKTKDKDKIDAVLDAIGYPKP
ncbi:hypothetical protein SAMN02910456_01934 [Ruminococcaceae bacterium YRB3002]|nr:hypothetical protein SAMN02910456_01934 [Ruminococcaceae bacterium YRB3002]